MEVQANYIRRIEIHGLWHRYDIAWELRPDVNILSGINGVGKTTILNRSVGYLEQTTGEVKSDEKNGVHVFFDNPEATFIPYDVIRSYDRPLIMGDFTARMADPNVKSELDWQLYLLQRRYLDYQVNIGNKMIELLSGDEQQRSLAPALSVPKRKFQDMIDELFSYTRKKIDRKSNDIVFYQDGERLLPYKLSSGEKQMLVILLTVLVRNEEHCVLSWTSRKHRCTSSGSKTYRHDTRTQSECAAHSHHPLACRDNGRLAGCGDRSGRYFNGDWRQVSINRTSLNIHY